jgi:cytoskeleton protein RodZ
MVAAGPVAPPPVMVIPTPAIPPSSAAAAMPPPAVPVERVVIRAKGDAWINIRDRAGQVLLNRILKAGESWTAPVADLASLTMTTGNAGGTEIVLDGTPIAALGGNGAVRRDIPLDPDRLRELPAPPAPRPAAPTQPQ